MHLSSMLRMEWFYKNYIYPIKNQLVIIDLGSQIVPKQSVSYKNFFIQNEKIKYVGIDMISGNNVDIVLENPYIWTEIPDDYCDILICGQCFEHIEFPWITVKEISRVVKPDGLICIIVPSMQPFHRYPVNTYNYFTDGMIALCKWIGWYPLHCSTQSAPSIQNKKWFSEEEDTILVAMNTKTEESRKKHNVYPVEFMLKDYKCEPSDTDALATDFVKGKYRKPLLRFKIPKYNPSKKRVTKQEKVIGKIVNMLPDFIIKKISKN